MDPRKNLSSPRGSLGVLSSPRGSLLFRSLSRLKSRAIGCNWSCTSFLFLSFRRHPKLKTAQVLDTDVRRTLSLVNPRDFMSPRNAVGSGEAFSAPMETRMALKFTLSLVLKQQRGRPSLNATSPLGTRAQQNKTTRP